MDLVDAFRSNPKTYWTFLKCFTKKGALHPVLKDGNYLISDDVDRASLLNHVFASKFSDPGVASYPPVTQHHLPALNHIAVSPGTVCDILKSIHVTKACGPDGISARIVHECASELSVPLAKLCDMSMQQGVFPLKWKQANIVPLHKKGDKKDPQNYRSVSLLSLFGKVMQRIVYDELLWHAAPVLSPAQHGFLPGRSCTTNLTTYLHAAWRSMSDRCQTDAIYTDFSSAFQSVNHRLLLHKLSQSYNVSGKIFDWFVSYLSDREQRVIVSRFSLLCSSLFSLTICRRLWRRPTASCTRTTSKSIDKSLLLPTVIFFRAISPIFASGLPTGDSVSTHRSVFRSRSLSNRHRSYIPTTSTAPLCSV